MIKKELKILGSSILYFSRLTFPFKVKYNKDYQQKVLTWLPLIGLMVGGIGALVYYICFLFLPPTLSLVLSITSMVLTTGAFHEDGFADVCDAFGGGYTKEQRLKIMKDSRIGAYAAIGLILLFALKILTLAEIHSDVVILVIIASQALSRWPLLLITKSWKYARETDDSKSVDTSKQLNFFRIVIAFFIAAAPLFLFHFWIIFLSIPLLIFVSLLFGVYFNRKINGYTGDCLGAVQQVNELVFYIFYLVLQSN